MSYQTFYLIGLSSALLLLCGGLCMVYYARRVVPVAVTPEEQEEIDREKERQKEEKELLNLIYKEARFLAKEIPQQLAIQNEMAFRFNEEPGKKRRKRTVIKFPVALITTTEIWFAFSGKSLPYGTSFYDIKNPNNHVAENMQNAIQRSVRIYEDDEYNLYLIANLKTGIGGIPKVVKWEDVHQALPASKPLAVGIGVALNKKLIYQDVRTWPHIFVAGSTDMGKSNQVKQWICSLILNNGPDEVNFYFIDLKEGLALKRFAGIPHCAGFAKEPDEAARIIRDVVQVSRDRLKEFDGQCETLIGWNAQYPHKKKPYMFLVVDELFDLVNAKGLRGEMLELIGEIHRKHRAGGLHDILCTQIVNKQVADIQIIGNAPARCCFSLPGNSQSMLVLNNGRATTLANHPGRCVYQGRGGQSIVQAPWITDKEVDDVIARVISGSQKRDFTPDDLWKIIRYNLGGLAAKRDLLVACDGQIGSHRLNKWLQGADYRLDDPESSVIHVDGDRFILVSIKDAGAVQRPRRLIPVNGSLPATSDEIAKIYWDAVKNDPVPVSENEETENVAEPLEE